MTHDTAFPFLTVLVLLPAGAALAVALIPAVAGRARPAPRRVQRRAWRRLARHSGPGGHHRRAVPRRQRWVPAGEPARVGAVAGHLVASRRRRHLGVPRPHGGAAVPPGHGGRQGADPAPVLRGLDAAARGGVSRELRLARPHHVLLVLRADARARSTSSSPGGASPAGPTRRSSSSSTPSSARPSCWWASWPWPSSTSARPAT